MGTDLNKPRLRVVAAALFDDERRVLIAERPAGKHMAGWWEFPGGKVGADETDQAALARELREELGVEVELHDEVATLQHDYPDRIVDLALWRVRLVSGEPRGLDGQQLKWVDCRLLGEERLLPADLPFIDVLQSISSNH